MSQNRTTETIMTAFFAGALLAAGITILLTPKTGREVREKLGDIKEKGVRKLKDYSREAKFCVGQQTKPDAFYYDGGDCWI